MDDSNSTMPLTRQLRYEKQCRQNWKENAAKKQEKLRSYLQLTRALKRSRDNWKAKALLAQQQVKELEKQLAIANSTSHPSSASAINKVKAKANSGDRISSNTEANSTQTQAVAKNQNNELTLALLTLINSLTLLISKFVQFFEIVIVKPSITQHPFPCVASSTDSVRMGLQPYPFSKLKGSVQTVERIYAAINLLINYNQQVEYEERWYISIPVIKSLVGGSQVTINEVLKNMKLLLDTHHQSLGLGVQHNRSFHQGQQVTDFVGWGF